MDIEMLIANANGGDVEAMLDLVKHYIHTHDVDDALEWAEKAAMAGSRKGMYRAVMLYNFFMNWEQRSGDWESVAHDAEAITHWGTDLLENHIDKLHPDIVESLHQYLANARYYAALACHKLEEGDKQEGVRLLEGATGTREKLLLSFLQLEADDPRWDLADVIACVTDPEYAVAEKSASEEGVYATAAIVVAGEYTDKGCPEQAVALLDDFLTRIADKTMVILVREERARYTQGPDGSWQYAK